MEDAGPGLGEIPQETLAAGPAAVLVNVHARLGPQAIKEAVRSLDERGVEVRLARELDDPAGLPALVDEAIGAGCGRVVVGGGDGTISAVASALAGRAALGVLPLGTGNDFARSLGIPLDLAAACRVAAGDRVARLDAGRVGDRLFLNAASVGVSVAVARRLSPRLKRRLGLFSFPLIAAAESVGHRSFRVTLETDEKHLELEALQVVVGNGRFHGGGRLVAPEATLGDARLDVYAILAAAPASGPSRMRNLLALARVGAKLPRGRHVLDPAVVHERTRRLRLEADPPQEIDVDGEVTGRTPATFEVLPGALRVLVPSE